MHNIFRGLVDGCMSCLQTVMASCKESVGETLFPSFFLFNTYLRVILFFSFLFLH